LAELVRRARQELAQLGPNRAIQTASRVVVILVRPARRLVDDAVDDAELEQVWGRDLQALGRFGRVLRALPENGGAPLGRDHGVVAELEDEHAIGDAERERAAGATLADDGGDDRDADPGHHLERDADGLALPALL